jgi:O-antigen/teichoic acid export membrane protein
MKKRSIYVTALGTLIPALAFVIIIPKLINDFGFERFGYISLIVVLLSVSSILDMGIARGSAYYISSTRGRIAHSSLSNNIWALFYLTCGWAIFICMLLYWLLGLYFSSAENIPMVLKTELNESVGYISVAIFFVILHAFLRGVLEGFKLFEYSAGIKIITALLISAFLYYSHHFSSTLLYVSIIFMLGRMLGFLASIIFVTRRAPLKVWVSFDDLTDIISYSISVSISNFASTIMNFTDRLVAGYFLSPAIYGGYSVLSDVIMRFLFIPGAVGVVLFPSISDGKGDIKKLIYRANSYILFFMVPIFLVFNIFGELIISWWLSYDVNTLGFNFSLVIFILSLGLIVSSLAQVPYAVIHGVNQSKTTAIIHFWEMVIFVPTIIMVAYKYEIVGIITVWVARIIVDYLLLISYQYKFVYSDMNIE